MQKRTLKIPVREMTKEIMEAMEEEGLIVRLAPHHHDIETPCGSTGFEALYEGAEGYGPHKIIALTVNRENFPGFGTHPDQEEFWLIGDNAAKPMYILVARMELSAFQRKVREETLTADDFYLLRAKYNDPEVSFFVMKKGIPHGEGIFDTEGVCPSFYVTESRDLPLDLCDMGNYEIEPIGG